MKKALLNLLCIALSVSFVLGGCNKSENNQDTSTQNTGTSEQAVTETAPEKEEGLGVEFPLKEKVTLTAFIPQRDYIEDITTNEFTKWYEEKTNVHIEWIAVPFEARDDQRRLVLASGDYPDIFFHSFMKPEEEVLYGSQGVFLPLNDFVKKSKYFKQIMTERSDLEKSITNLDGNIYSLVQINECYHCMYSQKMWINQKWLDTLSLKMPTTTDEFYEVLKAFKTQDPNQNGKADEVPMTGYINGWRSEIYPYLMNAFIYYDFNVPYSGFRMVNGKVESVVDKPEFKKGLQFIHKLYSEGLIQNTALTQSQAEAAQVTADPDVQKCGAFPAGFFGSMLKLDGPFIKDFQPLAPLKGPDGVQLTGYFPADPEGGVFYITKNCKNPEIAFAWADGLYEEEATLRAIIGREGEEWRRATDDEKDIRGRPAKYTMLNNELGEVQNVNWGQSGPSCRSADWRDSWTAPQDMYKPEAMEVRLAKATELYAPYAPKEYIPSSLKWPTEMATEFAEIKYTTIDSKVKEGVAQFISGGMDIDKDWDKYVKELNDLEMQKIVEMIQKLYDEQNK